MHTQTRKTLLQFSIIQAMYFAIFAVTSYQTVYLQEEGLNSAQIGLIVSTSSLVGLVFSPMWGRLSDCFHSAKGTFLLTMSVTVLMYAALPLIGTLAGNQFVFYIIYIPAIFAFKQSSNAMLDSWCIGSLAPMGVHYGSARMWGSVGYCVSSILLGALVGRIFPTQRIFFAMVPMLAVLLWMSNRIRQPQASGPSAGSVKSSSWQLLRNRKFVIYLIYALGLNIYLAVTLIFMPYILEAAGCRVSQVGTVTGFRALIEIVSMFAGAKLCKRFSTKYVMLLPGILFGIEHLCYGFASGIAGMLGIMILSGLAGGFFYSLGPSYIFEIVPEEIVNTAQALNAMDLTIVSIIGSAAGGAAIKNWGVHNVTSFCGILILALTVLFAGNLYRENKKSGVCV